MQAEPIVRSIGSVTENISALVDFHPRKIVPRIPSYVKNAIHFINITKNIQLDPQEILVTIDVSSLYTNIPHTEGTAAINKIMQETGTETLLKILISNLTYLVFTKIYFNFNDQLYEKKQGTAMGTRMAHTLCHYSHALLGNQLPKYLPNTT